ncbi:hypothetical protein IMX26_03830 [Clostridium sp. 'deep sea']|uniref:Nif3-like dinuclear metal center hexameric protein n=1 Tax=Clostridium sp. 'deep sea' TaxID=2779445 RepID=UPI0018964E2A|nr:hypothetical protein [Clostridium sp. 'deep sea']QOR35961.1 hypothetical protein IMX26_03830 [Clostridium sp. 'deep sea']
MNTKEIMDIALELAGLTEIPADSAILVPGENIKKVLVGVDMGTAELLLAKELGVDCVIGHHPVGGTARANFTEVMDSQIDRMVKAGVPINKAEKALAKKRGKVERGTHVRNYDTVHSAAKLLGMPLLSIHTPADILAENIVQEVMDKVYAKNNNCKISDLIHALNEMPEYQRDLNKPVVRVGSKENYSGRPFVTMAGGTGGGPDVLKAYFEAGVGTIVAMHIPEEDIKAVKEQNIGNVLVAGHMSSDSVGINAFLKVLEDKGIEVIRMSGVIDPH